MNLHLARPWSGFFSWWCGSKAQPSFLLQLDYGTPCHLRLMYHPYLVMLKRLVKTTCWGWKNNTTFVSVLKARETQITTVRLGKNLLNESDQMGIVQFPQTEKRKFEEQARYICSSCIQLYVHHAQIPFICSSLSGPMHFQISSVCPNPKAVHHYLSNSETPVKINCKHQRYLSQ